jgi:hypothetical protein
MRRHGPGTVRHVQLIGQKELLSRTSRKPVRPAVAGEKTEAGVSGWVFMPMYAGVQGDKKRAAGAIASDSLVSFVDHARLIASIVR